MHLENMHIYTFRDIKQRRRIKSCTPATAIKLFISRASRSCRAQKATKISRAASKINSCRTSVAPPHRQSAFFSRSRGWLFSFLNFQRLIRLRAMTSQARCRPSMEGNGNQRAHAEAPSERKTSQSQAPLFCSHHWRAAK